MKTNFHFWRSLSATNRRKRIRLKMLSPLHRLIQDISISSILGRKRMSLVLHTQHDQRLCSIVADRTSAFGRYTDHRTFFYRKHFAIHLKLSLSAQKEVQLLVILVRMQKAGFRSRTE